ncbi:MAG: hypothetical protein PUD59_05935 [bacterium]|nr:hypothetical protein [bacterium]
MRKRNIIIILLIIMVLLMIIVYNVFFTSSNTDKQIVNKNNVDEKVYTNEKLMEKHSSDGVFTENLKVISANDVTHISFDIENVSNDNEDFTIIMNFYDNNSKLLHTSKFFINKLAKGNRTGFSVDVDYNCLKSAKYDLSIEKYDENTFDDE